MTEKYRAAVLHGPKKIVIEKLDVPPLDPDEVLVGVKAANICPTDTRKYKGLVQLEGPVILGHEVAGVVSRIGESVRDYTEGDRVIVEPVIFCGRCKFCRMGEIGFCENALWIGESPEIFRTRGIGGAFAEYLKVPQHILLRCPSNISLEQASLTEPLACVLRAQEACRVGMGNSVVVIGGGPMGLLHIMVAKALGAGTVMVSEPVAERREKALELGAYLAINPNEEDPIKRVKAETEGVGVDVVMVVTGGRSEAKCTEDAIRMAAHFGRVNIFAGTYPPTPASIDPNMLHYNEIVLTGSGNFNWTQFLNAVSLIKSKRIDVEKVRQPTIPLSQIQQGFEIYESLAVLKVGINITTH